MDFATSIGLIVGIGVIAVMMLLGGDLEMFVSEHAMIIIFGGSFAATLIRFPLTSMLHGLPLGAKFAFTMRRTTARELVDQLAGIAEIARKQGPVGLEKVETEDAFLAKGIRYVADGYDADFIRDNLERDRDNFLAHLDEGQKIYRAIGDCAPAFGMVGTIIGMVQMFANMTDPSKLGPFMATALLATLYGAVVANIFCLPIADKLALKLHDEDTNRTLIIDGILMIRDAKSAALVREMLLAYLPEKHRHGADEPVPASRLRRRGARTMARKKNHDGHAGGHGWFVTFADLMGLLMSFFVMLTAFSTQDQQKLTIVAGSMREAFGVQTEARYSGVIESDGLPTRPKLRNAAHVPPEEASNTPTPEWDDNKRTAGAKMKTDREFALASASLRQALQDMPELTEISKHIMFEETKQGLNLEIIDQDGRSMFADGSKEPYERTRLLLQKLAVPLKATPLRVSITGHTAAGFVPSRTGYDGFDLSADRANMVRQILEREGLPAGHIFAVSGKADTQPLFPDDPSLAANRRVTITLMREDPPLPPNLKP